MQITADRLTLLNEMMNKLLAAFKTLWTTKDKQRAREVH